LFIAAAGADICYLEPVAHPFSALIGTLVKALMCGDIPECIKALEVISIANRFPRNTG
jgi:hypothetical protein